MPEGSLSNEIRPGLVYRGIRASAMCPPYSTAALSKIRFPFPTPKVVEGQEQSADTRPERCGKDIARQSRSCFSLQTSVTRTRAALSSSLPMLCKRKAIKVATDLFYEDVKSSTTGW